MSLIRKLWAKITRKGDEAGQYPVQQGTYFGRVADFTMLFPYGMHANTPPETTGLIIDEAGRVFMASSAIGRITVEEDEVVFFHPTSKSKLHFKTNGNLDIDTVNPDTDSSLHGDVNINTKNVNITNSEKITIDSTGDVDITTAGDANIKAGNVNIDASVTNLGVGGLAIARAGDPTTVTIPGGSSAGTYIGSITAGGANTSI